MKGKREVEQQRADAVSTTPTDHRHKSKPIRRVSNYRPREISAQANHGSLGSLRAQYQQLQFIPEGNSIKDQQHPYGTFYRGDINQEVTDRPLENFTNDKLEISKQVEDEEQIDKILSTPAYLEEDEQCQRMQNLPSPPVSTRAPPLHIDPLDAPTLKQHQSVFQVRRSRHLI